MRKIKADEMIDVNEEINHLIEFTKKRWTGFKENDMTSIMTQAWSAGQKFGRNWVDEYAFSNFFAAWDKERCDPKNWNKNLSKEELKNISYYDAISLLTKDLMFAQTTLRRYVMDDWDFSDNVASLVSTLKPQAEKITKIKPKGWTKLAQNYSDFDGMDEYCEKQSSIDFEEFKGVNSNSAGASGFHGRMALPYVMYDDKCQGRPPFYILVSSIVAHALFVAQHNNTVELSHALNEFKDNLSTPEYYSKIQRTVDVKTNNRFILAMLATRPETEVLSEEEFNFEMNKSVQAEKNYNNLSDNEKKKRNEENQKKINDLLSSLLSNKNLDANAIEDLQDENQNDKKTKVLAVLNHSLVQKKLKQK